MVYLSSCWQECPKYWSTWAGIIFWKLKVVRSS